MSEVRHGLFDIMGQHKIIDFFNSLRARIFIVVFLSGLISCEIMRVTILNNYETRAVDVRKSEVSTQMKILANHLITYNYLSDTSSEVINAELGLLA
ncbi:MAG: two-component sensor histidine kinase, partial [Butyrivibrio sp.]|nr:two-component sensor histidine kinase [Butyrivibrio sp.]